MSLLIEHGRVDLRRLDLEIEQRLQEVKNREREREDREREREERQRENERAFRIAQRNMQIALIAACATALAAVTGLLVQLHIFH